MLLAAALGAVSLCSSRCGCATVEKAAVKTGLKENPYYQLGDTWWDHGDIEEYYFKSDSKQFE